MLAPRSVDSALSTRAQIARGVEGSSSMEFVDGRLEEEEVLTGVVHEAVTEWLSWRCLRGWAVLPAVEAPAIVDFFGHDERMVAPRFTGLLIDAAGTLLRPAAPIAETYSTFAQRFGSSVSLATVRERFPLAMRQHRALRAKERTWWSYWHAVVSEATGVDDPALTHALWQHYDSQSAWLLTDGAAECLTAVRDAGIRVGILSNWDIRLRSMLERWPGLVVDTIVVSAEEGIEKPDRAIFALACTRLNTDPSATVMVGDSWTHDVEGARAAGLTGWHFGQGDLLDFSAVRRRLGV